MERAPVIVLGAGPAGLTAAYELSKAGVETIVLERDDIVGGIARTVEYKGYRFDIGGHRFFTKVKPVEDLWHELLGEEMLRRPRMSRIFYKGVFFSYPLKPMNALTGLGLFETIRCVASYAKARLAPVRPEDNFTAWVSNRFGKRLFEIFFKTYTEKVWGIPCDEIQAEWAAQRIKGLSLTTAVKNALFGERAAKREGVIKTLIDEFEYPRLGPGQMWEQARDRIEQAGSHVAMESPSSASSGTPTTDSWPWRQAASATRATHSCRALQSASSSRPWTPHRRRRWWKPRAGCATATS